MDATACRRGWQLLSEGGQTKLQSPTGSPGGNLSLLPLSSSVSVSLTFALQPFVATATLSELTSVLQLLSNIMGFQGTIFAAVGFLFGVLASSRKHSLVKSERNALASSKALLPAPTMTGTESQRAAGGWGSPLASLRLWLASLGSASTKLTAATPPRPQLQRAAGGWGSPLASLRLWLASLGSASTKLTAATPPRPHLDTAALIPITVNPLDVLRARGHVESPNAGGSAAVAADSLPPTATTTATATNIDIGVLPQDAPQGGTDAVQGGSVGI